MERIPKDLGRALETAVDGRGGADFVDGPINGVRRLGQGNPGLQVEKHGGGGKLALVIHRQGGGARAEMGNGGEGHHGRGATVGGGGPAQG